MTTIDVNPPRWVADPAGRFAQRYWDGAHWTEYVAGLDGGAAISDPLGPVSPSAPGGGALPDLAARATESLASPPLAWLVPTHPEPAPDGPVGLGVPRAPGEEPAAAAPAGAADEPSRSAGWEFDPTGRYPQRYWDGHRWTEFVAGAVGGAAIIDPTPIVGVGVGVDADRPNPSPAPDAHPPGPPSEPDAQVAPSAGHTAAVGVGVLAAAAATGDGPAPISWTAAVPTDDPQPAPAPTPVGGEAPSADRPDRRGRRLTKPLVVAAAVVALLLAGAAALDLAGVFGGGGSSRAPAAHRAAPGAKGVGTQVGAATVTTTPNSTVPAGAATVFASKDPCGLLNPSQIAAATGIPVSAGQPITGGCVWRGPNPIGGTVSALDRQVLGTKEGVVLTVAPAGAQPSVACTTSIPFVGVASGVCSGSGSQEGHYAMFAAAGSVVVDISVHTARPETDLQLEELAQDAYQRTV